MRKPSVFLTSSSNSLAEIDAVVSMLSDGATTTVRVAALFDQLTVSVVGIVKVRPLANSSFRASVS